MLSYKGQAEGIQARYDLIPKSVCLSYQSWVDGSFPNEVEMQFRLVYQGPLRASSRSDARVDEKHAIRKVFHRQLRELWNQHPLLNSWQTSRKYKYKDQLLTIAEMTSARYERFGYKFLPLINEDDALACSLDILFLRRDVPGEIINSGGDIDNRIKVLFDALRLPQYINELPPGAKPDDNENPFCCLLQDDKLIAEVRITTDRLLEPIREGEHSNDVCLVIHVRTLVLGGEGYTAFLT